MMLRTPIAAIVWELWRLTRAEVAWKLALPLGVALAALGLDASFAPPVKPASFPVSDAVAALALVLIVLPHLIGWWSLSKLNGGAPGFPLYLAYARPVRTTVIVGLPMAYLTAVSSAIYLVSAIVLRVTSGYAFPLLPVAGWVAAFTVIWTASAWSTHNRATHVVVTMVAIAQGWLTAIERLTAVEIPDNFDWPPSLWPTLFDFPRTDYAWIALVGLASFGVTFAVVRWQRRGDQLSATIEAAITWTPVGGWWDLLVSLFRFRCPTSSPTRAQVWFDLKFNGLPVLTIGVALAIVIVLASAVGGPIDAAMSDEMRARLSCSADRDCFWARTMPVLFTPLSMFIVLFLGGNAFGIRWRQGRANIGAFQATRAYGTAQLAVLKLLVKSACVLAALIAIGVSAWISLPLLGDAVFIQMMGVPLSSRRSVITDALAGRTGYEQLALAVVAAVAVAVWVASAAALGALRTRARRRTNIGICLLLLYGVLFVWLAVAVRVDPETASRLHLDVVFGAMRWIATTAIVFTTAYVFWRGFAEQVLTIRYASGAVAISAAFGAAWLTALNIDGVQLAGMSAMNAISVVSPGLLPLMASGLAPWSYSRVRHT